MRNIYTSGEYLETTQTWHAEDSAWKAEQIINIISRNEIRPMNIAEVGCGAGFILKELSKQKNLKHVLFKGYDISHQAIGLCETIKDERISFYCQDPFLEDNGDYFDVLLAIDVIEHVPDYMGFLRKCKDKAENKIFHIPLDIHVSSVFRNSFLGSRYSLGHLHYFTADSAVAVLRDTGHEIVDFFYTNGAFGLFKQHPSLKKSVANGPRWLLSKLSIPLTARLFGGYSLIVLTR